MLKKDCLRDGGASKRKQEKEDNSLENCQNGQHFGNSEFEQNSQHLQKTQTVGRSGPISSGQTSPTVASSSKKPWSSSKIRENSEKMPENHKKRTSEVSMASGVSLGNSNASTSLTSISSLMSPSSVIAGTIAGTSGNSVKSSNFSNFDAYNVPNGQNGQKNASNNLAYNASLATPSITYNSGTYNSGTYNSGTGYNEFTSNCVNQAAALYLQQHGGSAAQLTQLAPVSDSDSGSGGKLRNNNHNNVQLHHIDSMLPSTKKQKPNTQYSTQTQQQQRDAIKSNNKVQRSWSRKK